MSGGAGTYPAGSLPAGYRASVGAPTSSYGPPARACFMDPATGRWGVRTDGSGKLQVLDKVDAKVAWLMTIKRRSLPVSPLTGNTFEERLRDAPELGRPAAAALAARETFADMIAAGDIAILSVTIDQPSRGDLVVWFSNLRAAQSPDPTRPT